MHLYKKCYWVDIWLVDISSPPEAPTHKPSLPKAPQIKSPQTQKPPSQKTSKKAEKLDFRSIPSLKIEKKADFD